MGSLIEQIAAILILPPGNLIYFLVVAFTILVSFQLSINQWRRSGFPQGKRLVVGLGLLLLIQLVQFSLASLAWQNLVPSHTFLPPLDRAVTLLTLVIVAWLWLFPEPVTIADVGAVLMGLLVLTFFVMTLGWWENQPAELAYNYLWADQGSTIFALALLLISSLTLFIRRPNGWGFVLGFNLILLAGYAGQWQFPQLESDYLGVVRLSQMMAFPLLLYLPQRFAVPADGSGIQSLGVVKKDVRRYRVDPALVNEFLGQAASASPETVVHTFPRLVSELMVADLCLIMSPPDSSGALAVIGGYDLIKQLPMEGFSLDSRNVAVLASAIRRGKSLRLPSSSTSPDLVSLAQALNLQRTGHLLAAPVMIPGQTPLMALVTLLPYSNRGWTNDDQNHLARLGESLAAILSQRSELKQLREDAASRQQAKAEAVQFTEGSTGDEQALLDQVETLQNQLTQERSRAENLAQMISAADQNQSKVFELEAEIARLRETLSQNTKSGNGKPGDANAELLLALDEIARLKSTLANLENKPLEHDASPQSAPVSRSQPDEIAVVAQELRQPLSSIVVSTDLLLGETVGILGNAQIKIVERIKASVERMESLADDLIQLSVNNQNLALSSESLDLNPMIDQAVAQVMKRFRERNIILRLDISDRLPALKADQQAIVKILVSLLQNAGESSPQEGEVGLSAKVETKENEPAFVLIQVNDSGDGIAAEDLPKIFSKYSHSPELLEGKEDEADLAAMKTLVEAHGGRVWVDSAIGKGTTFSVLLPALLESATEIEEMEEPG